ncbi:MAG: hypothetical protein BAA01_00085 [Bacillus thermozeamaize]|uniref:Uncharacterized protein n=1 Tax=Bacillus thermozeamaize TaxID=230954 RepID=A0A1Y3PMV5_9BACI|nr:MAG: hypothetical protein BAA01_00085 [Bacillus thermozeamaize]
MADTVERRAVIDSRFGLSGAPAVVSQVLAWLLGLGIWRPLRAWLPAVTGLDAVVSKSELATAIHASLWTSGASLLLAGLVAALLRQQHGSGPANSFLAAVLTFPLYVPVMALGWSILVVERVLGRSVSLAAALGRFVNTLLRKPRGLFYPACLGAAVTFAILKLPLAPGVVRALCLGGLPIIAALSVLWMYNWTFDPLAALDGIKSVWDTVLTLSGELRKQQIAAAVAAKDPARVAREYETVRRLVEKFARAADTLTGSHLVTPLTVHVFVLLLVLVTAGMSVMFAVAYQGLHAIDPGQLVVAPGHDTFLDFLHLSVRTLLFSDDRYVYPEGP